MVFVWCLLFVMMLFDGVLVLMVVFWFGYVFVLYYFFFCIGIGFFMIKMIGFDGDDMFWYSEGYY